MWSLNKDVVRHAWLSIMLSKTCYIVCHSMTAYFNQYIVITLLLRNALRLVESKLIASDTDHKLYWLVCIM
jgi:hypothetical protein